MNSDNNTIGICTMTDAQVAPDMDDDMPEALPVLGTDDFLRKASEVIVQPLDIEGLGRVYLRVMTGGERDKLEACVGTGENKNFRHFRERFACIVLANEDGSRRFHDEDVPRLSKVQAPVLEAIFDAGSRLNGMSGDDVEELAKN